MTMSSIAIRNLGIEVIGKYSTNNFLNEFKLSSDDLCFR